jgi:hypothetical protein
VYRPKLTKLQHFSLVIAHIFEICRLTSIAPLVDISSLVLSAFLKYESNESNLELRLICCLVILMIYTVFELKNKNSSWAKKLAITPIYLLLVTSIFDWTITFYVYWGLQVVSLFISGPLENNHLSSRPEFLEFLNSTNTHELDNYRARLRSITNNQPKKENNNPQAQAQVNKNSNELALAR